jgi:hypothetical protein
MSTKEKRYMLVVDKQHVLNLQYGDVVNFNSLNQTETSLIWAKP